MPREQQQQLQQSEGEQQEVTLVEDQWLILCEGRQEHPLVMILGEVAGVHTWWGAAGEAGGDVWSDENRRSMRKGSRSKIGRLERRSNGQWAGRGSGEEARKGAATGDARGEVAGGGRR